MRTHKGQAVLVSVFLHESASAYWSACAHADQKPPAFAGVALLPIVVEAQPFPGPIWRATVRCKKCGEWLLPPKALQTPYGEPLLWRNGADALSF